MRFDIITLFPAMIEAALGYGVMGRAIERGLIEVVTWNPRDNSRDRHGTVDDRPYGGGPGMVMTVEPLRTTIRAARAAGPAAPVIYLSPEGEPLDGGRVRELAGGERVILLCGRYEGIDQRLIDAEVDHSLSIGDYVLSGGELPAMVVVDAVSRLVPGVLGHTESAAQDAFADGLLDWPHYTRPERVDDRAVPAVLLSGDHQAVARWRLKQALGRTLARRPDLLARRGVSDSEQVLLDEYRAEHND
jgi:tRNA (guanine37-N1)-methyltransferase